MFTWNDIPSFAIITGVNGIGKTQLVQLLKDEPLNIASNNRNILNVANENKYDRDYNVVNSTTGKDIKLILPKVNVKQDIDGLIKYYNETYQREGKIEYKINLITSWRERIQEIKTQKNGLREQSKLAQLDYELSGLTNTIKNYLQTIENLQSYAYDTELSTIVHKSHIDKDKLSEEIIRKYANPFLHHITEIEDFENFLKQDNEEYRRICAKLVDSRDHNKIDEISKQLKIYQIINHLFTKYGFNYFSMKNPFPDDRSINGSLIFVGKKGEEVTFDYLSSGEQMIVKFIIWAMAKDIRGNRINTMILDEPDAHLHPTMSKMMIDIYTI